jgi:hypothetical protein
MPTQPLSPPPFQSTLANSVGLPAAAWTRWFQQLWEAVRGAQGWAPLAFAAGWRTWSDATFADGEYTKDASGIVRLRGLVECTNVSDTVVTTLPEGYRPPEGRGLIFSCAFAGNSTMNVLVTPAGLVQAVGTPALSTWLSLDGIAFPTN